MTAASCFSSPSGKLMAVGVTSKGAAFEPGTPTPLFDHGTIIAAHTDYFPYAVTKDGQRFLISRPVSGVMPSIFARESARAPARARSV